MNKGFIALTTVLMITAVGLAIAASVALLSIGEVQTGLSLFKGEETYAFVDGCMEDALHKTATNPSYSGGTITRPEGTCTITASKTANTWTITSTTTATDYVRTMQVIATMSASLKLASWKEL